jgi:hypothetical protein
VTLLLAITAGVILGTVVADAIIWSRRGPRDLATSPLARLDCPDCGGNLIHGGACRLVGSQK